MNIGELTVSINFDKGKFPQMMLEISHLLEKYNLLEDDNEQLINILRKGLKSEIVSNKEPERSEEYARKYFGRTLRFLDEYCCEEEAEICGYCSDDNYLIVGLDRLDGHNGFWPEEEIEDDDYILKDKQYYCYVEMHSVLCLES